MFYLSRVSAKTFFQKLKCLKLFIWVDSLLQRTCGLQIFGKHLRNEFDFWQVRGILGFTLTLQETRSIHDSTNLPKIEFITYICISYYQSYINYHLN